MQLKVMGDVKAPLAELITQVLTRHLGAFDAATQLQHSLSSSGKFVSYSARIVMENEQQVEAIYTDLTNSPHVKIVF